MSDAETPMEASGDKKNRTYQESADATDHRKGTAAGETVQLSLMPVDDDQHSKDPEAESQADQTHSSRDPLQGPSAKQSVRRFDLRHRCWDEPEGKIGSGIHVFVRV